MNHHIPFGTAGVQREEVICLMSYSWEAKANTGPLKILLPSVPPPTASSVLREASELHSRCSSFLRRLLQLGRAPQPASVGNESTAVLKALQQQFPRHRSHARSLQSKVDNDFCQLHSQVLHLAAHWEFSRKTAKTKSEQLLP